MRVADGLDLLPEDEDSETLSLESFLRDAPVGCLFCRLGELGEGDDD